MSLPEREDMSNRIEVECIQTIIEEIKFLNSRQNPMLQEITNRYIAMIEALEKQIPKKPYIEEHDYGNAYVCTICETFIHYVDDDEEHLRFDYCPNCGQKIEW